MAAALPPIPDPLATEAPAAGPATGAPAPGSAPAAPTAPEDPAAKPPAAKPQPKRSKKRTPKETLAKLVTLDTSQWTEEEEAIIPLSSIRLDTDTQQGQIRPCSSDEVDRTYRSMVSNPPAYRIRVVLWKADPEGAFVLCLHCLSEGNQKR